MSVPFNSGDKLYVNGVPDAPLSIGVWNHVIHKEPHNWGVWNCVLTPEDMDALYHGTDPKTVQPEHLTASGYWDSSL